MRDFGLIGGVSGKELAALDKVVNRRRNMMLIGPATEEEWHLTRDHILARHRPELTLDRHFAGVHR